MTRIAIFQNHQNKTLRCNTDVSQRVNLEILKLLGGSEGGSQHVN